MQYLKKVLITGGAGFIGLHLAKLLITKGKYSVDLLDNFQRGPRDGELQEMITRNEVRLIERDLLSTEGVESINLDYDYIYHFAAIIGVAHVEKNPFDVLQKNTLMLIRILDLCKRQKKLERVVFASTSEVYAGTLKHFSLPIPTPETTPLALTSLDQPRTSYMLSKIYGEALCNHSGLPFTIVRPHNFYGPRMGLSHVIPELLQRAYNASSDGELEVFSPAHTRTFCFIEDAVKMMNLLTEDPKGLSQTFNIGNQEPEVRMDEVASIVIKTVGKNMNIKLGSTVYGSPVRRCPDMNKTFSVTGYRPQVSLEQGILQTFSWYKEKIFEGRGKSAL